MSKPTNHFNLVINQLKELHKKYPNYSLGQHIGTALADYSDIWGMTDKEIFFAFTKYAAELELDHIPNDDAFLQRVIRDGTNLDTIFDDDEDPDADLYMQD